MNQQPINFDDDSVLEFDIVRESFDAPSLNGEKLEEKPKVQIDTNRSIVMKGMPHYLEELRYKDPQTTIDYLFTRKTHYRGLVGKERGKIAEQAVEINKLKSRIRKLKLENQKEIDVTKFWRNMCYAIGSGVIGLFLLTIIIIQIVSMTVKSNLENTSKVPVSARLQETPNSVLASVNIYNGKYQGSGVVISKGPKGAAILSAKHNFVGLINGKFWVYYPDGSYTEATLLAVDKTRDLALARVDGDSILTHTHVARKPQQGELTTVGYANGEGPILKRISYVGDYKNCHKKHMCSFYTRNGKFSVGSSGSGVFMDDGLIGLVLQADECRQGRAFACAHDEIIAFLNEHQTILDGYGDWTQEDAYPVKYEDRPPLWMPKPNVPIYYVKKEIMQTKSMLEEHTTREPVDSNDDADDGFRKVDE